MRLCKPCQTTLVVFLGLLAHCGPRGQRAEEMIAPPVPPLPPSPSFATGPGADDEPAPDAGANTPATELIEESWVQMEVVDVGGGDGEYGVLLRTIGPVGADGKILLPIAIGENEAAAILRQLNRQTPPRPLTHELMLTFMQTLGGTVSRVEIEDLRDRVFFGRLHLRYHGRALAPIDARPSDLLALALGADVPIFAARAILEKAGTREKDVRRRLRRKGPAEAPLLRRIPGEPGISL